MRVSGGQSRKGIVIIQVETEHDLKKKKHECVYRHSISLCFILSDTSGQINLQQNIHE